ncbi:MAG: flavin monoamine oxidase family protein [Myxococcales bacterium]|nr:flavin monoamine oxidase family protein [Myxococcales bacterium]
MSERTDVAIIGAGFAGLSAARALARAGRAAVVLEARDRVGGRVYTERPAGGPWVDLGGQWVGPTQDHLLGLLREQGAATFPTWTTGDNLVVVEGRARRYRGTIPRLGLRSLIDVGLAQWRLERMARQVPLDAPWRAKRAAAWDATTLGAWLDQHLSTKVARDLLGAGLESVFAASPRDLSLLHALFYIHSGKDLDTLFGTTDGAQATRVDGGMQPVAERLAVGLDVRLEHPVRKIEHGDQVTIHHDRGALIADRVIVAIPPHLVAAIDFAPALPRDRAALVAGMPMGAVIKCTAVYPRPFWRDRGLSGLSLSDRGPIHVAFDNSPPDGSCGVLMGFAEADAARRLGTLTIAERQVEAVACFARVYGDRARAVDRYADHVWERDPWSGGCYGAFAPPGLWTSVGRVIRTPVGRLHWAGTETATAWSGYIDGAIASGLRAAAEV